MKLIPMLLTVAAVPIILSSCHGWGYHHGGYDRHGDYDNMHRGDEQADPCYRTDEDGNRRPCDEEEEEEE